MTTYARIKRGKVAELTALDPAQYYVATKDQWVVCPDDTKPGTLYDANANTFTLETPEPAPFNERLLDAERAYDAEMTAKGKDLPYRPENDTDTLVPPEE